MKLNDNHIDTWQKATIIGSVWGAFEIIAGSILHNLAIPTVAGTILAALGVTIMVAGARVFGGKGIFWRSALVCAALKTVSPSPVILSPMIGITLEGLLMEFGVLLLGNNIIGYILGGGLALISVLGFKFVRLIMIYGADIFTAYQSVFNISSTNQFIKDNGFLIPILILVIIFVAIGSFSAYSGYKGGNAIKLRFEKQGINFLPMGKNYKPPVVKGYKGGVGFLIFHVVWLVGFIVLKDIVPSGYWLSGGVVYIILSVFRYGRIRRMLSKPTLWIVITLVSTISSLFILLGKNGSFALNLQFIEYSFTILIRAAVVIIAFACINIEIRSKGVSRHFSKSIFSPLTNSYTNAYIALPSLISTIKDERNSIHKPLPIIERMFSHFTSSGKGAERKVYIITGSKQEGKTTFLRKVIENLKSEKVGCSGFLAEGIWDENGKRSGFELVNIVDGVTIPLSNKSSKNWVKFGSYYFNPAAIEFGNKIIKKALDDEVVIMDEIGLFELEGMVWANSLTWLLSKKTNPIIISVRRDFTEQVVSKWNLSNAEIVDIKLETPVNTALRVIGSVKNK